MKDLSNCAIEFTYTPVYSNRRYIYWRIKPQEISFWRRLFKNPWRRLERNVLGNWNPIWDAFDYKKYNIQSFKTYSDILNFEDKEWHKILDCRRKYIDEGEMWKSDLYKYRVDYI